MHISEGVLSTPVLAVGAVAAALGTGIGLARMDFDRIPRVSVLASAFFVASLVHVPVGPVQEHLILNGLAGILLGWAAFPAILVGLFLQAILFQYGGLTTLGVNTFNMAAPAVVCYCSFHWAIRRFRAPLAASFGFAAGACAVLLSAVLTGLSLMFTSESLTEPAYALIIAHVPVVIVEGLLVAIIVTFLKRVKPEALEVTNARISDVS
jgi:cobalt/nickel transport system permease protein